MHSFEFIKAKSISDAVSAAGTDSDAKFLGGGQTLLPTMKLGLSVPSKLISLSGIEEMRGVKYQAGELRVGGATPHAVVMREAATYFPALAELAGHIGDPAVRNRGTIGGSLANNDPSACYPSAVLACDAIIETDKREIAANDYFEGMFSTSLIAGEVIKAVRFPIPIMASYQKFIQPASRFALVGVFVARFANKVGVAVTGASENGVFRWHDAEDALARNYASEAVESLALSDETMIADLYGSKAYRAHLIPVLTARAVAASMAVEP